MKKYIYIAVILSLVSASSAHVNQGSRILSVQDLLDSTVKNKSGESLGTLKEFVGDKSKGDIKYAILLYNDEYLPVPWFAFEITNKNSNEKINGQESQKQNRLVLNISKAQISKAPVLGFLDIQQKVDNFYSRYSPPKERAGKRRPISIMNMFKVSDILQMNVDNKQDDRIGELRDLVIDSTRGNILYGLVRFGNIADAKEKIAAVPWSSIDISRKTAKLDAHQDKLEAAVLEDGDIKKLSQRQFANKIFEVFGTEPYWSVYGYEPPERETHQRPADDDTNKKAS